MSYFPLIPRHWPSFLNVWIGLSHRKPDRCELVSLTWVYRKSNLKQLFESVLILLWNQLFLVFYLYLPIEVAQRDKMARGGGHSPLAGVAWVWFCRAGITCTCGLSLLLVHVLALRVFLWCLWFSSFHKTNIPNSNSTSKQWKRRAT